MDPWTSLPIDCAEGIFRHLSFKDLLECTLVCPRWNEFIGQTGSCMEIEVFEHIKSDLKSTTLITLK